MSNPAGIELAFPHERIEAFTDTDQALFETAYEYAQYARFLRLQTFHILKPEVRSWSFSVANGSVGSEIFPDKFAFNNLVRSLGYEAPLSVLVDPSNPEANYVERIESLDEDRSERFCKPLNSTQGRGAAMFGSAHEAYAFAHQQNEAYLVQTYEKPANDWRYILHYDQDQLRDGQNSAWHILFKVVQPTVMGDGHSTINQLVKQIEDMPDVAKQKYRKYHQDQLMVVPEANQVVKLVETGNRERGAYGLEHSQLEQDNLDQFMLTFLKDVESYLGTTLATTCFDLGLRDPQVLKRPYDFLAIQKNVVFYEHQMPFGMKPYLLSLPQSLNKDGLEELLPARIRRQYLEGRIYTAIIRSVIRSGVVLR